MKPEKTIVHSHLAKTICFCFFSCFTPSSHSGTCALTPVFDTSRLEITQEFRFHHSSCRQELRVPALAAELTQGPQSGPSRPVDTMYQAQCLRQSQLLERLQPHACSLYLHPIISPQKHTKPPPHGFSSLASVCVPSTSTILPTPSSCFQLGKLL